MSNKKPRWKRWRRPLLLLALAGGCWLLAALTGTPHAPYRVPGGTIETSIAQLVRGSEDYRKQVEAACVETHMDGGEERFKVGLVEFDDQGSFWSRDQLATVERQLEEAAASPDHDGVLTVVFTHGWQHNASVCDQYLACFRDMLEALANVEDYRARALHNALGEEAEDAAERIRPRYVFGVYIGWRGLANRLPVLRELSFYNRKAAAHRVGRGDVLELFTRLEVRRDRLREQGHGQSKLVILGHSFGGAVTYSAVSKVLHERLARAAAQRTAGAVAEPIRGFGDLVVLVNPAFEASLYSGIYELSQAFGAYPDNQPAALVTVSSDTDTATHLAFPAGRFFATRFVKTRDRQQARSLTDTIGNFEPFNTHRLELATAEELRGDGFLELADLVDIDASTARGASDCKCDYFETQVKDAEQEDPFGEFRLQPAGNIFGDTRLSARDGVPTNTPFITATAVDAVVTDHSGIFNRTFLNFLRSFLLEMDRRTMPAQAIPAATTADPAATDS